MGIWAVSMIGFVVHASSMCRILRGFLIILFPTLKNRESSRLTTRHLGSRLRVVEKSAVKLMAEHLHWLRTLPEGTYVFSV